MIKNRTAQLIYQTIYLTLGFVGLVASLGIFDNINTIRWDFYVHFTNISNFLCIGVMLAALIQTARKKEDTRMLRRALRRPDEAESPAKIARCKKMLAKLLEKTESIYF